MRERLAAELIGRACVVEKSPNPAEQGLRGTIIDETANTVLIEENGHRRRIAKAKRTFRIGGERIEGDAIGADPIERIKKAKP